MRNQPVTQKPGDDPGVNGFNKRETLMQQTPSPSFFDGATSVNPQGPLDRIVGSDAFERAIQGLLDLGVQIAAQEEVAHSDLGKTVIMMRGKPDMLAAIEKKTAPLAILAEMRSTVASSVATLSGFRAQNVAEPVAPASVQPAAASASSEPEGEVLPVAAMPDANEAVSQVSGDVTAEIETLVATAAKAPLELYWNWSKGILAAGVKSEQGFTILRGSRFARRAQPSVSEFTRKRRAELVNNGRLREIDGEQLEFVQDVLFKTASQALTVVHGVARSGSEWLMTTLQDMPQSVENAEMTMPDALAEALRDLDPAMLSAESGQTQGPDETRQLASKVLKILAPDGYADGRCRWSSPGQRIVHAVTRGEGYFRFHMYRDNLVWCTAASIPVSRVVLVCGTHGYVSVDARQLLDLIQGDFRYSKADGTGASACVYLKKGDDGGWILSTGSHNQPLARQIRVIFQPACI